MPRIPSRRQQLNHSGSTARTLVTPSSIKPASSKPSTKKSKLTTM